ncbi:hypothetical protein ACF08N_35615 [Streptomyces sp. NPDC015127]|uniref:hypothetical protein n=1 Tax=Streptomyces sp. NPDC015127 TaxID=3364939 RepID=UPI0036FCFC52
MIRCEVTATSRDFTGSWVLARMDQDTSPRMALGWLRGQAAALAHRLDPQPDRAALWAPPCVLEPTPEPPLALDAAEALRRWIGSAAAQDDYLRQLDAGDCAALTVDGPDALYTLTTAIRPFVVAPWVPAPETARPWAPPAPGIDARGAA